jgi:hypothetical protein
MYIISFSNSKVSICGCKDNLCIFKCIHIQLYIYMYLCKYVYLYVYNLGDGTVGWVMDEVKKVIICIYSCVYSHRGINEDHVINVDQHSTLRNKCKYSILYLHLFRGFKG